MVVAEKMPNLGHSVVFVVPIQLRSVFLGICSHAAKLVDGERSSKTSDAFLPKNGLPTILSLDKKITNKKYRRENDYTDNGCKKIKDTLNITLKFIHPIGNEPFVGNVVVVFDIIINFLFYYYITAVVKSYCTECRIIIALFFSGKVSVTIPSYFQCFQEIGGEEKKSKIQVSFDSGEAKYLLVDVNVVLDERSLVAG